MSAQQVIEESQPMLDDVLGRIGLHRSGSPLEFAKLRVPFSQWLLEEDVAPQDLAFLASLVGAFICEYLIDQVGAERVVVGQRIALRMPVQEGVAREFDPYTVAAGLLREKRSVDGFLTALT